MHKGVRVLAVAALVGGACASPRAPVRPSPAAAPSPSPGPLGGASCEPRSGGRGSMLLREVRAAPHSGFDRVVFEFVPRPGEPPAVPAWTAGPATPPLLEDGSGAELEVEGAAFLGLRIRGSGVDLSGAEAREVYRGPPSLRPPDTAVVQEVRRGGDFEDTLTWYVGLRRASCFVVRELRDPVRIVVDVEAVAP